MPIYSMYFLFFEFITAMACLMRNYLVELMKEKGRGVRSSIKAAIEQWAKSVNLSGW